jgi:hypothetical protein
MYEKHANDHVWCYRPLPVPAGALEHIVRSIEGRVGEPYSFFELPARWIDNKLFRGRIVTRWLTKPIWGGVCSSVIAEEFERAGYPIAGRPGWAASPADIEALFLANPGEFPVTWCGYPREYAA